MKTCPACNRRYGSNRIKCPRCHAVMPDRDEIAAACRLIQATWSARLEAARAEREPEGWTVPEAWEVTDHRRRKGGEWD